MGRRPGRRQIHDVRAEALAPREELVELVAEYHRLQELHRTTHRGSRARRRTEKELASVAQRFERTLTALVPGEALRQEWRAHLYRRAHKPAETGEPLPAPRPQLEPEEPPVSVTTRGGVPRQARDELQRDLQHLVGRAPGRVLSVRATLVTEHDPALERPAVAKATVQLAGRTVRAHVAAATHGEASKLLVDRLKRSLAAAADRNDRTPRVFAGGSPRTRPERRDRPPEGRALVRRKTVALAPMTPEEAAWEMHLLDHDFHLFTNVETGDENVVYHRKDGTLGLQQPGSSTGAFIDPFRIDERQPPVLGVEEALELLDLAAEPFVFFVDRNSRRGAVVYRRYDGAYGLVAPG